jgi:hypothetical protein
MSRFSQSKNSLEAMCCVVVANLAYGSEENKGRVRRAKFLDVRFEFLASKDRTSEDISYVCLAAQNVTSSDLKNRVYMGAYGGVEALARLEATHRKLRHASTVATLGKLARGGKTCQMKIRDAGGVDLILLAMQRSVRTSTCKNLAQSL